MHHWIGLLQKSKGDSRVDGQEFLVRGQSAEIHTWTVWESIHVIIVSIRRYNVSHVFSLNFFFDTQQDNALNLYGKKKKLKMIDWQYMKNALNEKVFNSFIHPQAGCIKRWSQERKVPLWNWRSAGLFSPQTLWTTISHQSAAPPSWELWSSTASALWCSRTRRSSRTLVSSLSMSFSFFLIIIGKYTNVVKP